MLSDREPFSFATAQPTWDRKESVTRSVSTGESGRHLAGQKDTARQLFIQSVNRPVNQTPRQEDRQTSSDLGV